MKHAVRKLRRAQSKLLYKKAKVLVHFQKRITN